MARNLLGLEWRQTDVTAAPRTGEPGRALIRPWLVARARALLTVQLRWKMEEEGEYSIHQLLLPSIVLPMFFVHDVLEVAQFLDVLRCIIRRADYANPKLFCYFNMI